MSPEREKVSSPDGDVTTGFPASAEWDAMRNAMAVAEREHRADLSGEDGWCSCGWRPGNGLSGSDTFRAFYDHQNEQRLRAALRVTLPAPCENDSCVDGVLPEVFDGADVVAMDCPDCPPSRWAVLPVLQELGVPEGYELVERDGPHFIDVTEDGWSIQHPARCRPNLLDCLFHRCIEQHVAEYDVVCVDEPGRYSFTVDDDGGPTFTPASRVGVSPERTDDERN